MWYSNNEELREWVVLQPGWIMNAVYRIIDDVELQNRHGLILPADFERLWSDGFYKGRQNVLKKMLQVFKIIFPQKTKKNTFILPARLLSIPKESIWPRDGVSLRLQYDYVFMPRGLVNQR
ncbi:COR domain-containing protein [Puia sp. P3]|uniref:COR domain-containing protein n=1 Tax=Puia sp. P3 TaxID=3423952 RepID=UPI003D67D4FA